MKHVLKAALAAAFILALASVSCANKEEKLPDGLYARIDTNRGQMVINLEYRKAPLTVVNFVGLAEGSLEGTMGTPFYDGLTFHRIDEGFAVMGGDPAADGTGDPGWNFPDEINPDLRHDSIGVVGMSNHGENTNGCQFYITLAEAPYLDDRYTIFGSVVRGLDVLKKIKVQDRIEKITIERVGDAAKAFKTNQAAWNELFASAAAVVREKFQKARAAQIAQIKARWPELKDVPNGFMMYTVKEGSGQKIERFWLVNVAYRGMLPDGTIFDQSDARGGPIEFEVGAGQVIPGWDMVMMDMKKGEKRIIAIPPEYAYGPDGYRGIIPPNSYLIFELEVTGYTE